MLIRKCECGERVFGLENFCPECGEGFSRIDPEKITQHDRDEYDRWAGAFCSKDGHAFQTVNRVYPVNFCANCGEKLVGEGEEGCSEDDHILKCAGAHMKFNCPDCGKEIDPG